MRIPLVEENVVDLFVDVNTTMMYADGLIVSRVEGVLAAPPSPLTDGMRVAVAASATGAFAGQSGKLAVYRATGAYWDFYPAVLAVHEDKLYLSFNNGWILK